MFGRVSTIGALSSAVVLAMAGAQETVAPQVGRTGELAIAVQDGRLTATIQHAPLLTALEELSARTRVAIVPGSGLHDDQLSAVLKAVTVEEGLRDLLKGYDTFFFYSAFGPRSVLTAVWVYPKGAGAALRPVPPSEWASTMELEAAVSDRDPVVREHAYDALMSRSDAASRNLLWLAIRGASETDTDLRQRLLSTAVSNGIELPRDLLADLVRADGTEEIRVMALDALSPDPEARAIALGALSDPSTVVRDRAREVLLEIDSLARRRESIGR
jgi:hypothetical protein